MKKRRRGGIYVVMLREDSPNVERQFVKKNGNGLSYTPDIQSATRFLSKDAAFNLREEVWEKDHIYAQVAEPQYPDLLGWTA